jgi:hypothetical protein
MGRASFRLVPACSRPQSSMGSRGSSDVPQFGACSRPAARQLDCAGERARATHAAGGIGGRRQHANQWRAVWSCQSAGAQRSQRHRQCVEPSAPWQKPNDACRLVNTQRFIAATRDSALCGGIAAYHQPGSGRHRQAALPPPEPTTGQHVYRNLPRLLALLRIARSCAAVLIYRRLCRPINRSCQAERLTACPLPNGRPGLGSAGRCWRG